MYLIIGVWGGPNRVYAAVKFFLYTLLGSLLMLVALIYLYSVCRQLRDPRLVQRAARHAGADPALRRVLPRVRRQGADVAGAHVAAGCARRGADRRLGGPGGDHAEDRRVRFRALHPADPAGRVALPVRVRHHAVADRRDLHRLRRAGAAGHEEADRVFVDRAHGIRHAGLLPVQPARHRGRARADDLARFRVGCDVPVRRRACTTACIRG